ncbi:MAG: ATP-binding protein [Eubacterium sp.]
MRNLSIRAKITLWFSVLIILITAMMFTLMLIISTSVLKTDVKDTLRSVVEINSQEIEYIDDLTNQEMEIGDQYIEYNNGYLEIDDDFLNESNGVYTALYDSNGNLLYGQNLINAELKSKNEIKKLTHNKEKYFTLNKALSGNKLDGLILQGVINENANKTLLTGIVNLSLFILPILALMAIIIGYFLAGRFLSPIRKITSSAESITDGNDLSMRIEVDENKDELNKLAETFNRMFSRLEHSFEEEKQFTSDISHELRTPVTTILAQCELTLEKERSTQEYRKSLEVINRQGMRMKYIVEEMLHFSRLERLDKIPDATEVNLSALFRDIAEEQKARNIRSIKINDNIEDNIIITGNSDMLAGLINNLISNAYRYGKDNGNIMLSLEQNDSEIVLSVQDDGIGINDDEKAKIFNRFYQANKSRTSNNTELGVGLGLSIVSAVAKLHGGYMEVESKVNEGSTFIFKIPKNNLQF